MSKVHVMVTVAVARGDRRTWRERTLTLTGDEQWACLRWPSVFPDMLARALRDAPEPEVDQVEPTPAEQMAAITAPWDPPLTDEEWAAFEEALT